MRGRAWTLVCAGTFVIAGSAGAQTVSVAVDSDREANESSLLDRSAQLLVRDASLATALTRLSEASGVPVAFSPTLLSAESRRVDCDCRKITVRQALEHLLRNTSFGYQELRGEILVLQDGPAARALSSQYAMVAVRTEPIFAPSVKTAIRVPQVGTITGQVTDAATGQPLGGAQIRLEATRRITMVRTDGRYLLTQVPAGTHTLVASMIGYSSQGRTVEVGAEETVTADFTLEASTIRLGEVLVTAQKREERLQDVPLSIAIVTPEMIDRRRLVSAEDYLRGIPGVNQMSNGMYGQSISIRGIETRRRSQNLYTGTTVATYFGETATTTSGGMTGGANVDAKLVDIERVEVLRGPQGTAFGSASMGGAVRTIPVAPKLDRFEGKVAVSYSQTSGTGGDNNMIQGVTNLPLMKDKLALRAVGYRYEDSGFYRNRAGSDPTFQEAIAPYGVQAIAIDEEEIGASRFTGGRIATLFQASDALRFTLSYLKQRTEVDGYPVQTSGTYEQTVLQVAPEHVYRGRKGAIRDTDIDLANALLEYDLGWANLLGTYSYVKSGTTPVWPWGGLASPLPLSSDGPSQHRARSGEVRLTTEFDGAWNFLYGLYAEDLDDEAYYSYYWLGSPESNPFGTDRFLDLDSYWRAVKQKAAYAEASWEFLPGLTLTGGVRAYDYERTERRETTGVFFGKSDETHVADASGTSFRGNLAHKLTDNALVYAGWSQGFRLGRAQTGLNPTTCDLDGDGFVDGTSITIESTRIVNSDNVNNYELGGKFTLLDHRLMIAADVYRIDWSDIPALVSAPIEQEGCFPGYVTNAGVARSEGTEVQVNFYVTRAFRVDVGGSWIRARLSDDLPALDVSAGARLPVPKFNANLGLQYEFDIGGSKAFMRADPTYVGRFNDGIRQAPSLRVGGYVQADASARVTLRNINVDLFVRNLTNADAFISRTEIRSSDSGLFSAYGYRLRPRTIGLQLSRNL